MLYFVDRSLVGPQVERWAGQDGGPLRSQASDMVYIVVADEVLLDWVGYASRPGL